MKINTKERDDHQITMIVTLDSTQMLSAKHRAARNISERKSVPGFRPGKAPYDVILRTFGEGLILEDAVDLLIEEIYPKALAEAGIEAGAPGSLEKMENLDKSPKFTFTVPLASLVKLGDYSSLKLPYDWKSPEESDVDKALEDIRRMYAKTENVNRPAALGDFVLVDIKGDLEFEGKTVFERASFPVFITDKKEKVDEWPFVGFSKKLIGVNVNENLSIKHRFSKSHPDKLIQSKEVSFNINVKMVRGTIFPEINEDFAKQLGAFESVQSLRDSIKANLASRSKADYDDEYFSKLIAEIKSKSEIKYAPQILEHEIKYVLEDIKARLAKQGMEFTAYLKSRELEEDKFISEEVQPIAVKRLERSLLLEEISKKEEIEISKEVFDNTFQQTYIEAAESENFQKYMKKKTQPPKQMMNALAMESANRAYLQQTLEKLKALATGQGSLPKTEKTSSNSKIEKKPSSKKKKSSDPTLSNSTNNLSNTMESKSNLDIQSD